MLVGPDGPEPDPHVTGSLFRTHKELVLLWNQFSYLKAGSLSDETDLVLD